VWSYIPPSLYSFAPVRIYGRFLHRRICATQIRKPVADVFHTFFLRNRPQFEAVCDSVRDTPSNSLLRIAAIGCSSGAELYSLLWLVKSVRPDLRLEGTGVDIDPHSLETARRGEYARSGRELSRLSAHELEALCDGPEPLFICNDGLLQIRSDLTNIASWVLGDAMDPHLSELIGTQQIVVINNLLCHLYDDQAEQCLENIAKLVGEEGYLCTFGVDLDVKSRVLRRLGFVAIDRNVVQAYLADNVALEKWPKTYWGREPINLRRRDWLLRYSTVYQRRGKALSQAK